jgi:hypothetical protein
MAVSESPAILISAPEPIGISVFMQITHSDFSWDVITVDSACQITANSAELSVAGVLPLAWTVRTTPPLHCHRHRKTALRCWRREA